MGYGDIGERSFEQEENMSKEFKINVILKDLDVFGIQESDKELRLNLYK